MAPVEQVLADIWAIVTDEHDEGSRFERSMLHAFHADPNLLADNRICPVAAILGCPLTATSSRQVVIWAARLPPAELHQPALRGRSLGVGP